jgi:hypothetical protein
MSITRSEGYRDQRRQNRGRQGQEIAKDWLSRVLNETWTEILSDDNYFKGDLMNDRGHRVEVKTQPISQRYKRNFVEVFEETSGYNKDHLNGLHQLATLFNIDPKVLQYNIPDCDFTSLSFSLEPLRSTTPFLYINCDTGLIALYSAQELLSSVREQLLIPRACQKGRGNSNEDTYSVFVKWPQQFYYTHKSPNKNSLSNIFHP